MKVAYKDMGDGPILFCLPPWPSGSSVFIPLADEVQGQIRIIAPDLPGWGGYSNTMLLEPTIFSYMRIVQEFIKSFEVSSFNLLGYSFGGLLAQTVVLQGITLPEKVLYVSTIHSGDEVYEANKIGFKAYEFISSLHIDDELIDKIAVPFILHKINSSAKPDILQHPLYPQILEEDKKSQIDCLIEVWKSIADKDWLKPYLKKIPTHIIMGDNEPDFIHDETLELSNFLDVPPILLRDADHNHLFTEPEKSKDYIISFLRS